MERFEQKGNNYLLDGAAKIRGLRNLCKKKLCLLSSDKEFLFDLMFKIAQDGDCFEIKICKSDRLDVFFGQCTFTNDASLGDAWAQYESHPKVWAVIHDDEFCDTFKSRIRSYTN